MISKDYLRKIVMLGYLDDEMLDELLPISELLQFEKDEYVFRQKEPADRLYMLLLGKVLLEQGLSENVTIIISAIKPGYSFGWSSMLDEAAYTTAAVSTEPSQMISFRADKLKRLFEKNHSMGYIMSQRLLRIIKKRYDIRTEQFIKLIRHHPELGRLL